MPGERVPVVFIHGLWLHSTSWLPWAEKFRAAGYPFRVGDRVSALPHDG